jgi:hypothetical protein
MMEAIGGSKMTQIIIDLKDDQAQQLAEEARRRDVTLEELVRAGALALLAPPDPTFDAALDYVLEKNQELYRRLA